MPRLLLFLALVAVTFAQPITYTDSSRLDEIEQAVINLIENDRGWWPLAHSRPSGDLIQAFNKIRKAEKDERVAQHKAEESRRVKEEAEWRIKRYAQMREACNKYYTAENWITEDAWKECCATRSPDRPNNIGCDLDSGTPGYYYKAMQGGIGRPI